jgi:hypothetical protein
MDINRDAAINIVLLYLQQNGVSVYFMDWGRCRLW